MIELAVLVAIFAFLFFREVVRRKNLERDTAKLISEARSDAVKKSRDVIEGNVLQQLIPYFPEYKYVPSDSRFISSPLDLIVFNGLSKGCVEEVIFIEVKSGKSYPTKRQKSVKDAIENGKVRYELIRMKDQYGKEIKRVPKKEDIPVIDPKEIVDAPIVDLTENENDRQKTN
jgi:predicted Holliday junction resolvase-like endonuclease